MGSGRAAAAGDDRFGLIAIAGDPEIGVLDAQLLRRPQAPIRREVHVERRTDRRGDVAGDRVDRLDLAAVARGAARVQERDVAQPTLELLALDDAVPLPAEVQPTG